MSGLSIWMPSSDEYQRAAFKGDVLPRAAYEWVADLDSADRVVENPDRAGDCTLDEAFQACQNDFHPDGWVQSVTIAAAKEGAKSLSVGDVVVDGSGTWWRCDPQGWAKVAEDTTLGHLQARAQAELLASMQNGGSLDTCEAVGILEALARLTGGAQ